MSKLNDVTIELKEELVHLRSEVKLAGHHLRLGNELMNRYSKRVRTGKNVDKLSTDLKYHAKKLSEHVQKTAQGEQSLRMLARIWYHLRFLCMPTGTWAGILTRDDIDMISLTGYLVQRDFSAIPFNIIRGIDPFMFQVGIYNDLTDSVKLDEVKVDSPINIPTHRIPYTYEQITQSKVRSEMLRRIERRISDLMPMYQQILAQPLSMASEVTIAHMRKLQTEKEHIEALQKVAEVEYRNTNAEFNAVLKDAQVKLCEDYGITNWQTEV